MSLRAMSISVTIIHRQKKETKTVCLWMVTDAHELKRSLPLLTSLLDASTHTS